MVLKMSPNTRIYISYGDGMSILQGGIERGGNINCRDWESLGRGKS
jgi:hypothetical protein